VIERVHFSLDSFLQPSPDAWEQARTIVEQWNAARELRWMEFGTGDAVTFTLDLEDPNGEAAAELTERLEAAASRYGVEFERTVLRDYDDADFEAAPYLGFSGAEIDIVAERDPLSGHPAFVLNADDNFDPEPPCPQCGTVDPLQGRQRGPFVVDEHYVDREYDEDRQRWEAADRPWDVLSLPGSVLLVSVRVAEAMGDHDLRGYRTDPVLTRDGRTPSPHLVQLVADTVKGLCGRHGEVEGSVCPACGRVLGRLAGEIVLRREQVGERDVFWHPTSGWTCMSARAYRLLREIDAKGLTAREPVRICDHATEEPR
jgi:hypothetical protein